jgi:hypothetical protein
LDSLDQILAKRSMMQFQSIRDDRDSEDDHKKADQEQGKESISTILRHCFSSWWNLHAALFLCLRGAFPGLSRPGFVTVFAVSRVRTAATIAEQPLTSFAGLKIIFVVHLAADFAVVTLTHGRFLTYFCGSSGLHSCDARSKIEDGPR